MITIPESWGDDELHPDNPSTMALRLRGRLAVVSLEREMLIAAIRALEEDARACHRSVRRIAPGIRRQLGIKRPYRPPVILSSPIPPPDRQGRDQDGPEF